MYILIILLVHTAFWDARKALIPMVGAVREAGTSGEETYIYAHALHRK